jgi:hypothetical protein
MAAHPRGVAPFHILQVGSSISHETSREFARELERASDQHAEVLHSPGH